MWLNYNGISTFPIGLSEGPVSSTMYLFFS